jgi:hypothetical protein
MGKSNKLKEPMNKPWAGVDQPRTETGRFESKYEEPRGNAIALRLPQSLDVELRKVVGWNSKEDNAALKAWIEAAIFEKLQREPLSREKFSVEVLDFHGNRVD